MACLTSGGIKMASNHRTRTDSPPGHLPHLEGRKNGPFSSGVSQSVGLGSVVSESPRELVKMQILAAHVWSKLCGGTRARSMQTH